MLDLIRLHFRTPSKVLHPFEPVSHPYLEHPSPPSPGKSTLSLSPHLDSILPNQLFTLRAQRPPPPAPCALIVHATRLGHLLTRTQGPALHHGCGPRSDLPPLSIRPTRANSPGPAPLRPSRCSSLPCISTSRPRHGLHPHNGRTPLALSKGRRAQDHAHKRTPPLAPRPVTRRSCTSRLVAVGMHGRPMPSRKPRSRYPGPAPRLPRSSRSRTGSSPLPKPIIYFLERSQQVQVHYNCSVARQAPRGPAHAKPLDPGHRQAPRTGPTASPSIRVFAKPFKPGQRQAPRSTPSHRTPPTERATQQSGGAWHAPALLCCSPSGDANGVRLP